MTSGFVITVGIVIVVAALALLLGERLLQARREKQSYANYVPYDETQHRTEGQETRDLSVLDALVPGAEKAEVLKPDPLPETPAPPKPAPVPLLNAAGDLAGENDLPMKSLWENLVTGDDGPLDVQDRIDMVSRLELVGERWCVDALHAALDEESDPQVNAAARDALARMGQ